MNRRLFLAALGSASLLSSCSQPDAASSKPSISSDKKPNIVLIMADDLGYGHLGCYGQKIIKTPNIDKLAADGARFTQAYAGCTVCAPSRSALITGLHTGHTPLRSNGGGEPLPVGIPTLATVLKKSGYRTALFGKWGLGAQGTEATPDRHGFDEYFGPLHQVHAQYYYPTHLWRNGQRVELPGNQNGGQKEYVPDVLHASALEYIQKTDGPFFLYMPSIIPHHEFQSPAHTLEPYKGRFEETPFVREDRGFAPQPRPAEHFAGMVARLDEQVGEIRKALERKGIANDTLIIFTSDNGSIGDTPAITKTFEGGGPLRGYKGDLYEGGIRVPFIACQPNTVPAGGVVDEPLAFWDLMPTFADLAGGEIPKAPVTDGVTIAPLLFDGSDAKLPEPHPTFYWEYGSGDKMKQAVRMGDWKAIRLKPGAPLALYELRLDPDESDDVSAANPKVVEDIEEYLKTCRQDPPVLPSKEWDHRTA